VSDVQPVKRAYRDARRRIRMVIFDSFNNLHINCLWKLHIQNADTEWSYNACCNL
jgi:hypothetical protein